MVVSAYPGRSNRQSVVHTTAIRTTWGHPSNIENTLRKRHGFRIPLILRRSSSTDSIINDDLTSMIRYQSQNITEILSKINHLETEFLTSNKDNDCYSNNSSYLMDQFQPLLGLYDVSFTQSLNQQQSSRQQVYGNNPVGGRWTRPTGLAQQILRTRRTFQHILPLSNSTRLSSQPNHLPHTIAEAINIISLEAFFGYIRCMVILRGDVVPLRCLADNDTNNKTVSSSKKSSSPNHTPTKYFRPLSSLAVKIFFDPPRIIFGRKSSIIPINLEGTKDVNRKKQKNNSPVLSFMVGPTSSVVIDTTYYDDCIRIGRGGISGTIFVFSRCLEDNEETKLEANEFREWMKLRPIPKRNVVLTLVALSMMTCMSLVTSTTTAAISVEAVKAASASVVTTRFSYGMKKIGLFLGGISLLGLAFRLQTSKGGIED
jgi:hypothetical protein